MPFAEYPQVERTDRHQADCWWHVQAVVGVDATPPRDYPKRGGIGPLNRSPPERIVRLLRQEVGYVCPIPGCGSPILTWHHFNPSWAEENHHRAEDMIALCHAHHAQADNGQFEVEYLRRLKQSVPPRTIRTPWQWGASRVLKCAGGNYAGDVPSLLEVRGEPVLWTSSDSLLGTVVNAMAWDEHHRTVLSIRGNWLTVNAELCRDLVVTASKSRVCVRLNRATVFEIAFARLTEDQLALRLAREKLAMMRDYRIFSGLEPGSELVRQAQIESARQDSAFIWATGGNRPIDRKIAVVELHRARVHVGDSIVSITKEGIERAGGPRLRGCFMSGATRSMISVG